MNLFISALVQLSLSSLKRLRSKLHNAVREKLIFELIFEHFCGPFYEGLSKVNQSKN